MSHKLHERRARCFLKLGAKDEAEHWCKEALKNLSSLSLISNENKKKLEYEYHQIIEEINKLSSSTQRSVDENQSYFENIKVSYGVNKTMPSASDAIDMAYYEGMGRGLVATRDIKVGDVLVVEESFATFLELDHCFFYCHHCLRYCLALIPCFRCSVVMFCGEKCRRESWESYHHVECFAMSCQFVLIDQQHMKDELLHLSLKVLVTASSEHKSLYDFCTWLKSINEKTTKKEFDDRGQYVSTDYRTFYNLSCNIREEIFLGLATMAVSIITFLETCTSYFKKLDPANEKDIKMFIGGLIFRHLKIISCNKFRIQKCFKFSKFSRHQIMLRNIGFAIFTVSSLINHSCNPNVTLTVHGKKIILVACSSIHKGEQVFVNYTGNFATCDLEERRKFFMTSAFNFECKCIACLENWPLRDNLPLLATLKCQYCSTKLPNAEGVVYCTICHKKTNSTYVLDRFTIDCLELQLLKDMTAAEKLPRMAEILQTWDKLVEQPWSCYYEQQQNFYLVLWELSSTRCDAYLL